MSTKRLRVFAGPNGSGKSTITQIVRKYVDLGVYVNADDIKVSLQNNRLLDFSEYGIRLNRGDFVSALRTSSLSKRIENVESTLACVDFCGNQIRLQEGYVIEDYFVSFMAAYMREGLLDNSSKFTIETVMSHVSKLEFMQLAKDKGFKVYLYFVSLVDPELNKRRVQTRVEQGGHPVDEEKIVARYGRTMDHLYEALTIADSAYLFDNSAGEPKMFAVKENGILEIHGEYIPTWFNKYVSDKFRKA